MSLCPHGQQLAKIREDLVIFDEIPADETQWMLNNGQIRAVKALLQFSESLYDEHSDFVNGHLALIRELGRRQKPQV